MREFRSIFISDVHLGTPDCQAGYLLDFLQRTRAQTLYLVGDIVDLEALRNRAHWPASHAHVLAEFFAIAARGTRVLYLPGNHDQPLRSLAGGRLAGLEVHRRVEHIGADGRRYRITHGDEFDNSARAQRWLTWLGVRVHRGLLWCNRSLARVRRRIGLPYLPLSIAAKTRSTTAMNFIRAFERGCVDRLCDEGFDGHICGHIHFGNIRHIDDAIYLNCGDWVEHCTALVEEQDGGMKLLHWTEAVSELACSPPRDAVRTPAVPLGIAAFKPMQAEQEVANDLAA